ncbi:Uncharacterised protein [Mycobacteroides abscessus subsp. abscessus]|nr:Uncharacterised protein [Mycobacteroides abscessus subsp. abscessus]
MEVCTPSPNDCAYATTASTGRPIFKARSPRASSTLPPPWASTKPRRRRSLARENRLSAMPLARIISVSAVAAMSPNPMMASSVRSSNPPASASCALPSRILSTPSSTETAAVAHAATGWIIAP